MGNILKILETFRLITNRYVTLRFQDKYGLHETNITKSYRKNTIKKITIC
jgi:hypothetical protein